MKLISTRWREKVKQEGQETS